MKFSGRKAVKTRQESKRLNGFSSKYTSGSKGRVFYRIFEDEGENELLVAPVWGHNVDHKSLPLNPKRIFIPSLSEVIDGVPVVADVLYQFSKISKLFLNANKEKELKEIEDDTDMTSAQRKAAMKNIEEEYENKSSVVGPLRNVISTECVYIPMTADGKPEMDKAELVTQDLSDGRMNTIYAIMSNPQYKVGVGQEWVEVEYVFGNSGNKSKDGNVDPMGVVPENSLEFTAPEDWLKIKQLLGQLPNESDTISKRNSSHHKVDEADIKSAVNLYIAMEGKKLKYLSTEEDINRLNKNAKIIASFRVKFEHEEFKPYVPEVKENEEDTDAREAAPTMENLIEKEDIENARKDNGDEEIGGGTEDLSSLAAMQS